MYQGSLVIDGRRIETVSFDDVRNPANNTIVGQHPLAGSDHIEAAIAAARCAFPAWAGTADSERAAVCRAIADTIESHAEELVRLLTLEQGKPLNGMGSRFEIGGAVAWTRATSELSLPAEVVQDGSQGRIELHRKPIGVVASITPWNWPVMIACWPVIPAIRAANAIVIKPSPLTPLSTLRLVELINDVTPAGVVNSLTGHNEVGAQMTVHPHVGNVTFTGSTATGRKVMESGAASLKRLTLELGGNDAGIVLPDVDPDTIAEGQFWGAFINSGQTCAGMKRLYVHDSLYEGVCAAHANYTRGVKLGDGLDEASALGPVQNRRQYNIVAECIEDARAKGGRILIGGNPDNRPGNFHPLTLVADVEHGCRLVDEERFGPALPIIRYRDIDEVITRAIDSLMGLGGSVWSADPAAARKIASKLECGSVWVNKHGAIQPDAPFGGVKQSGFGTEFGAEGLKEFTTLQTLFC
jgi:acyl-CoA reductase-like NAD-dependent aldehyde dehydrogenase